MATHNPAEDVVAFLNTKTANGRTLASGTNLFACEPRVSRPGAAQFPSKCVFVWDAAGAPPMPYMGTPALRGSLWRPRVQIRVRGEPDAMQEARLTARAVRDLLHRASITNYASCLMNESSPIPLGEGSHAGYEFALNCDLICGGVT